MLDYTVEIKLKHLLEEKKMTQMELSKISGVRQSTISDIVRGSRTVINFEHLSKIANALELRTIDEIIDFKK